LLIHEVDDLDVAALDERGLLFGIPVEGSVEFLPQLEGFGGQLYLLPLSISSTSVSLSTLLTEHPPPPWRSCVLLSPFSIGLALDPTRRLLDRFRGFSCLPEGLQLSSQILVLALCLFPPAAFLGELLFERGLCLLR
jgi:hypothetical protein